MSLDLTGGLPSRRRADEFARLLDGGGPTNDPGLAPLVGLARSLQSLPLGPTPDFRDGLRQRLLAVAAVAPAPSAARPASKLAGLDRLVGGWRAQRRFAVAAGAMASVVAIAGVGVAGSRSLPGDPLYGIKRGTEALQLSTTHGLQARGELHLRFAKERLSEVERLSGAAESLGVTSQSSVAPVALTPAFGGSLSSKIVNTLERMDAETLAGSHDLTSAYKQSHDTAPLEALVGFTVAQQKRLNEVLPDLPDAARSAAAASLGVLAQVDAATGDLLSGGQCTDACRPTPVPTPTAGPQVVPPAEPQPCTCSGGQQGEQPGSGEPSTDPSTEPNPGPSSTGTPDPRPTPSPTKSSVVDEVTTIISQLPSPLPSSTLLPTLPPVTPIPVPITLP
ncbi:MAG: hypothetical protein QOJ92_2526 [Frankiales bacterium]|nr:hypothetical protein [Frankiales bacterium]